MAMCYAGLLLGVMALNTAQMYGRLCHLGLCKYTVSWSHNYKVSECIPTLQPGITVQKNVLCILGNKHVPRMPWCSERGHRVAGNYSITGRSLGLCVGEVLQQGLDSVKAVGPIVAEWTREDRRKGRMGWFSGQEETLIGLIITLL